MAAIRGNAYAPSFQTEKKDRRMSNRTTIVTLTAQPEIIAALADRLIETVANHGSIGFMQSVTRISRIARRSLK